MARTNNLETAALSVLAISYGRHVFMADNPERQRMEACAAAVGEYHMVVFTHQADGLSELTTPNGLFLHPTNSRSKFTMLFDAVRIGLKILSQPGSWVITSQDPFEAGLAGWWLHKKTDVALNVQEHGDFFSTEYWKQSTLGNRLRYRLGLFILRRATSVRVVSKRIAKTLIKQGVAAKRIQQLAVRSDVQPPTVVKRDNKTIEILTMARLVPQKNLALLLRAFATVVKRESKAHLTVVGSGPLEVSLQQLASTLGISQSVTWVPWTDTPGEYLATADIYALSSDWEGWARVLIEAMAAGVPVVTTDVGCVGEVLLDDTHGLVVPVGDESAFTAALETLVSDRALRHRLGEAAQVVQVESSSRASYAVDWAMVLKRTVAQE